MYTRFLGNVQPLDHDFKVYDYALTSSEISDLVAGKSIPNGTYIITARHSGKVLDVLNDGRTNGSNVQQYQANGCGCQQWILTHQANGPIPSLV